MLLVGFTIEIYYDARYYKRQISAVSEVLGHGAHTFQTSKLGGCVIFYILYYDQQMQNYFTNYHTPTYFDTIVSSSGSL